ncbi:MAG: FAD-binding protein [Anaerolineales bacterium]
MTSIHSVVDLQSSVSRHPHILVRGGGTKPALSIPPRGVPPEGVALLDLSGLSGVLEYEPSEFTFTALAGTRVSDVQALLSEHGQYLPFDPPLVEACATLGGTVASGLSGPGRYRYGGVRDFILGVKWINGDGQLVRGGGKVVKNAAGFDFPKLFVGSLGQLGVLAEVTFKVFPKPEAYATLRLDCPRLDDALNAVYKLYGSQLDIEALDVRVDARSATLYVRLGGLVTALSVRLERLSGLIGRGEVIEGADDAALWRNAREFEWMPRGAMLVKVPLTPARIAPLEAALAETIIVRRYSAGGQVGYFAVPTGADGLRAKLEATLSEQQLSGLVLFGQTSNPFIGAPRSHHAFAQRVKQALDPANRFVGSGELENS